MSVAKSRVQTVWLHVANSLVTRRWACILTINCSNSYFSDIGPIQQVWLWIRALKVNEWITAAIGRDCVKVKYCICEPHKHTAMVSAVFLKPICMSEGFPWRFIPGVTIVDTGTLSIWPLAVNTLTLYSTPRFRFSSMQEVSSGRTNSSKEFPRCPLVGLLVTL